MPTKSPSSPDLQLLSNGHYTVMLHASGAGFSQWDGLALTRWREDATRQPWGSYLLLRDEQDGAVWSATPQPYGGDGMQHSFDVTPGRVRFGCLHADIESALDVAVAVDADVELRRLTLRNHGDRARSLTLTSYAEMVLGPIGGDNAHPAFSKMFVQTEWDASQQMLLGTRRRRSDKEAVVWAAQALRVQGSSEAHVDAYETDRARFLGRGRTLRHALAMDAGATLSGSTGCVLDPVFAQRQTMTLAAGASVTVLLWTQLADSRDGALALSRRIADPHAAEQLFAAAEKHAVDDRSEQGIDATQYARFSQWLGGLLGSDASLRAPASVLARAAGGAPTLWAKGISGDRPILLLRLTKADDLTMVRDALLAQRWWRGQRLAVDVVLLDAATDALQGRLDPLLKAQQSLFDADDSLPKAEVFALREDALDASLRDGLMAAARVILGGVDSSAPAADAPDGSVQRPASIRAVTPLAAPAASGDEALEFANERGGFCDGGRAYRIDLEGDRHTPAPWVNVIANADFGFIVSAEGGGYTWSLNSQQNPLTPWPNDPVSDSPHDILYLRDEDDGALWSATALPIRVAGAKYSATHGKGWSRFRNDAHGIALELIQCVATNDPVKMSRLRLSNPSARTRHLSITGYVDWALGPNGSTPAPFVVTTRDASTGALLAQNRWRADFADRVAFVDMGGLQQSCSGDRAAFLGKLGDVDHPAALQQGQPLNDRVGAGLDPCGALQTRIELPPHTQIDITMLLGDAASADVARALIATYRNTDIDAVLQHVGNQWNGLLDTVQVSTPDRAMDLMLNDWLPYQVLACRVWARTGYYQASGAYGYRDQLQDVMALCVSRPDLARQHLLRAAGRQFAEGDVQHWWLPPGGAGIRTKISDDRIWLAHVAMHYVKTTGDAAVLNEDVAFIEGPAIAEGAGDAFFQPTVSSRKVSLYEHCALALDSSLTLGAHGLPLIRTGDWNDGMNSVGEQGRGESSWLGWFVAGAIDAFAPEAMQRGDDQRADRWQTYASAMRTSLEDAWDGQWYRRGYYDDGAPLGSKESDECRIDTIAQSWSVIAGKDNHDHAAQAMASVDDLLVDHAHQVHCLFTPPFDHGKENPGYIKGYPPGVRENGGQYTHGATWSVFAWAGLGDGDRAAATFDLLNPVRHADSAAKVTRYKVEPYVVSADVYSVDPHVGRGGWTWYTGSAAWLYRAGLEAVLGFHLLGDSLRIEPCIPRDWPGFSLTYLHKGAQHITRHEITVENPRSVCAGVNSVTLDGDALAAKAAITLLDDGKTHQLRIVLG